jgi:SH3-like domain-containing protein
MIKITLILSIALLTACGGKNQEAQASNSVQNSSESSNKETQTSEGNTEETEEDKEEKVDCGSSRITVMWDDADPAGTNIRNSPKGEVIKTLNSSDFPDGCAFEIVEQSNGWFRIQGGIQSPGNDSDIALPGGGGWIHSSVISVGTRNYGSQTIEILDSAENGKSVGRITKESYGLRVLDLCGSWVKISFNGMTGWISNQWICGIPWTTCN